MAIPKLVGQVTGKGRLKSPGPLLTLQFTGGFSSSQKELRFNYLDQAHRKEMQKSKMAVWGGLTNSCEKKRRKRKGEKERYKHLNAEFQRIAKRDKKAFLSDQCKVTPYLT